MGAAARAWPVYAGRVVNAPGAGPAETWAQCSWAWERRCRGPSTSARYRGPNANSRGLQHPTDADVRACRHERWRSGRSIHGRGDGLPPVPPAIGNACELGIELHDLRCPRSAWLAALESARSRARAAWRRASHEGGSSWTRAGRGRGVADQMLVETPARLGNLSVRDEPPAASVLWRVHGARRRRAPRGLLLLAAEGRGQRRTRPWDGLRSDDRSWSPLNANHAFQAGGAPGHGAHAKANAPHAAPRARRDEAAEATGRLTLSCGCAAGTTRSPSRQRTPRSSRIV